MTFGIWTTYRGVHGAFINVFVAFIAFPTPPTITRAIISITTDSVVHVTATTSSAVDTICIAGTF